MTEKNRIVHREEACSMEDKVILLDDEIKGIKKDVYKIKEDQNTILISQNELSAEFRAFYTIEKDRNSTLTKAVEKISDVLEKVTDKQNETDKQLIELKYQSKLDNQEQNLNHQKESTLREKDKFLYQVADAVRKHWVKVAATGASGGILYVFYQMAQTFAQIAEAMPK